MQYVMNTAQNSLSYWIIFHSKNGKHSALDSLLCPLLTLVFLLSWMPLCLFYICFLFLTKSSFWTDPSLHDTSGSFCITWCTFQGCLLALPLQAILNGALSVSVFLAKEKAVLSSMLLIVHILCYVLILPLRLRHTFWNLVISPSMLSNYSPCM